MLPVLTSAIESTLRNCADARETVEGMALAAEIIIF